MLRFLNPPVAGRSLRPNSPIGSLPNELLVEIFERCRQRRRSRYSELPMEVVISHVSRRWRNLVINSPSLWTRIHVFDRASLASFESYLARSQGCDLDLRVDLWEKDGDSPRETDAVITFILDRLIPHVNRWGVLNLRGNFEQSVYMFLSRLHPLRAPVLKTLEVGFDYGMEHMEGINFPAHIFTGGAPVLTTVRLDMLQYCWPPLSVLETLDFRQPRRSEVVYSRMLRTLTDSQTLTCLCIHGAGIDYQGTWRVFRYSISHLPALRSLQLVRPSHLASHVLLAISAPRLDSLWLEETDETDLGAFFQAHGVSVKFPALRCLTMKSIDFDGASYHALSRVFPTVRHLRLICPFNLDDLGRHISRVNRAQPGRSYPEPVWPDLHTVAIRSLEDDEQISSIERVIREVVHGRQAMRRPIHRVILDAELLSVVSREGLDRLIPVEEWKRGEEDSSDEE